MVLVFFAQIVGDKYPMSKEGKEGKKGAIELMQLLSSFNQLWCPKGRGAYRYLGKSSAYWDPKHSTRTDYHPIK